MRARFPGRRNLDRQGQACRHDPFVNALLWVTIKPKYVNMADIIVTAVPDRPTSAAADPAAASREPIWDLIELLFFAYRDFVSDPDEVLAQVRLRPRASPGAAFRQPQSRA